MKVFCNSFYITVNHNAYGLLFINANEVQIKWKLSVYQQVVLNSWEYMYILSFNRIFFILNSFNVFIPVIVLEGHKMRAIFNSRL